MLLFMQETCDQLMNGFEKYADKNEAFELKTILGKYSMDTIASCAFGVDSQSLGSKEESMFVKHAKKLFEIPTKVLTLPLTFCIRKRSILFVPTKVKLGFWLCCPKIRQSVKSHAISF